MGVTNHITIAVNGGSHGVVPLYSFISRVLIFTAFGKFSRKMKNGFEEIPFHGEIEAVSCALDRGDHLCVVAIEDVHSLNADEKIAHFEARIICRRASYHRVNL